MTGSRAIGEERRAADSFVFYVMPYMEGATLRHAWSVAISPLSTMAFRA